MEPAVTSTEGPSLPASELRQMRRRPFGLDDTGRPIVEENGKLVVSAITYMQEVVGKRTARTASEFLSSAERDALIELAQTAALHRLVVMLNAAIPDERYHVVREVRCQVNGAPCCEWEFTWQPAMESSSRLPLVIGALLTLLGVAYVLMDSLSAKWLWLLGALLPFVLAWHWVQMRQLRYNLKQWDA